MPSISPSIEKMKTCLSSFK